MDTFRLIRPADEAMVMRGLRVLVGGPEAAPGQSARSAAVDVQQKIDGFLAYAATIRLDARRQVLAMATTNGTDVIVGMSLWVPSPGRTAMLFGPGLSEYPEAAPGTQAALIAAMEDAQADGVVLAQAMMEPSDAAGKTVFTAAGLSQLATLTYMERRPPVNPPAFALPADLSLSAYEAGTHAQFVDAITRSYEQTLDCPAMSGMRDVQDVIEGHKAVGIFDPQLWSLLIRDGQPLGCLLLAEIPARQALELVYLGLTREARGQGLGRLMMQRVLAIASRRHFAMATLAVDVANVPAARLYRRCGYASVAQRIAMIRQLR